MRVLAVAARIDPDLYTPAVREVGPDLVLSTGNLPFEYLEWLVTLLNVPLLYVPGDQDPDLRRDPSNSLVVAATPGAPVGGTVFRDHYANPPGPLGCRNVDGRVVDVRGVRVAGLGGAVTPAEGFHCYTERQQRRRARRLRRRAGPGPLRRRGPIDVLLAHDPPRDVGELPQRRGGPLELLVAGLTPGVLVHGARGEPREWRWGAARVIEVAPSVVFEL